LTTGVQAQTSAGTPSAFPVAADSVLATLEFLAALDHVAEHAAGPLGAAQVRERRPSADLALIGTELGLVAEGATLLGHGEGLEVVPVPDLSRTLARLRIQGSVLDGSDCVAVRLTLVAARQVARELRRVAPKAPALGALEVPVPDRRIESRLEQSVDPSGEVLDTASPELARARREVQASRDRLVRKLEQVMRGLDAQAVPPNPSVTVRSGRYVIPVRRDSRARPQGIVHDESGSAGTLFIEPTDAIEFGNALRAAIADESREVLRVFRELTELLRPHRDAIRFAHDMCVRADDATARARYLHGVRGTVPVVGPAGGPLQVQQGRHPLLLARGVATVPFDLVLEGAERTLLVSGPNAGGKTVLLKATGLFALLAQSGIAPPVGPGTVLPLFTQVFADIGDHQSIAADLSTFSAHVRVLRDVLGGADGGTLVLLDELGSGTDPAEGAALAWATLEALTRRGALTLATTHLGALKSLAAEEPGVVNGSLEFDLATLSPTYRFQKGLPGRSYGLAIARRFGVDSTVVARAEAQVPEGERALDRLLHAVEARDQVVRAREAEAAERLAVLERKVAELTAREEAVEAREQEARRRDREADQRARAQARAVLLDARRQVEAALEAAAAARSEAEGREARRLLEEAIRAEGGREGGVADGRVAGRADGQVVQPGMRVRLATGGVGTVEEVRPDGRCLCGPTGHDESESGYRGFSDFRHKSS
jgi:DNA mismatch repair protein MutS2